MIPAAKFEKVPWNASAIASPAAPSTATNEAVLTPSTPIAVIPTDDDDADVDRAGKKRDQDVVDLGGPEGLLGEGCESSRRICGRRSTTARAPTTFGVHVADDTRSRQPA